MRLPFGLSPTRAAFFALGFVPIGCLCLSLFGVLPLALGARYVAAPAVLVALLLGRLQPGAGRRALYGFLAGLIATGWYDVTRLLFVWVGLWPDFIPSIGRLVLLDDAANPLIGYLWRFIGNGGAMGCAFAMLPGPGVRRGVAYGVAIWACLIATLLFAPHAQQTLFPLNPATGLVSLLGHLDYGAVLGFLVKRWVPEALERRVAAAPATTGDAVAAVDPSLNAPPRVADVSRPDAR